MELLLLIPVFQLQVTARPLPIGGLSTFLDQWFCHVCNGIENKVKIVNNPFVYVYLLMLVIMHLASQT